MNTDDELLELIGEDPIDEFEEELEWTEKKRAYKAGSAGHGCPNKYIAHWNAGNTYRVWVSENLIEDRDAKSLDELTNMENEVHNEMIGKIIKRIDNEI